MRFVRSSLVIVVLAFGILLAQSAFAPVLSPYPFSPVIGLPLVFALGAAPGVSLVRGATTSFAIGYLYDVFTGNPLGIHTLVFVLGFLGASLVAYLISFRGILFEMALSFGLTFALGALTEVIRALTPHGMTWSGVSFVLALVGSSVATALVSPLLFALVRRIDPESARGVA